jgi:hypothetical protein
LLIVSFLLFIIRFAKALLNIGALALVITYQPLTISH